MLPSSPLPAPAPWRREAGATIALAWPLALTNLAQMAIMTTDMLMIGHLGPQALAAQALAINLYHVVFMIGFGLTTATAPLMAQALGRARHAVRDVRRSVRAGLWACALVCLPSWAILWHTAPLLHLLGQQPDTAAQAEVYMRAMMWGMLPLLAFMTLRAFIAALERPRAALVVTVIAIGLNALFNWGLIFGVGGLPALGLQGAGIASTLASLALLAGLAGFIQADRRMRRYHLFGRLWRPDLPRLREVAGIGLPIAATMLFEVGVFNAAAFLMGLVGVAALAAHAIALQLAAITFMVPMGLAQAATVRVGLAAGRADPAGVRRAGWVAIGLGGLFMAAAGLVMLALPETLAGLFLDRAAPAAAETLALAATFLAVVAAFQVADGVQAVGAGALRGLKDTRIPMLIMAGGYWLFGLPLGAWLAFRGGLGGLGLWIGLAVGLFTVAGLLTARWMVHGGRRPRLVEEAAA